MTESKKSIEIEQLNRTLLCRVLGISSSTLKRALADLAEELKQEFPEFNNRMRIFHPELFFWLCKKIGLLDKKTVVYRIAFLTTRYKNEDIEMIEKIYFFTERRFF